MSDTIHIVVATDANYAIHTRVLLESIKANNSTPIHVHILAFNLDEKAKALIVPTISDNYTFYAISDEIIRKRLCKGEAIAQDRSLATFARCLIPELLSDDIHRCFYLDVDAIVLNDLSKVYSTDLEGYAIAGVLDTNPIARHRNVGLSDDDKYINAGMILWNLDYCREHNVVEQFAEFITARNGIIDAMDQGTINGVLSHHIKALPPHANALTTFFEMSADQIQRFYGVQTYTSEEILEARRNPTFVHFTPSFITRPWVKNCRHPLAPKYWEYRKIFESSTNLAPDNRKTKIKILSSLFHLLPFCIFHTIVKILHN